MKLAILTQYYPPELGAPQARLSELAAHVVRRGHEVTILTAMPNYPTGRVYPGYGGLWRREQKDGVSIVRTPIYPTQQATLLKRLTNYFSFVASSSLGGAILLDRADYLMVESPPLFLGLAGLWLSRVKRARLIFNVSDLWPESAVRLGLLDPKSRAYRLSARLEALCYRHAWLVTGQSREIVDDIATRFPQCSTFLLSNGVDASRFHPGARTDAARRVLGPPEAFIVLYAGLHGLAQGLDHALAAADRLRHDPQFRFVFIGDGPEKAALVRRAAELQLPNAVFLDSRPSHEIPALLAASDAVLVSLKTYLPGAVPSKLYEAMASARPVVLMASGEAVAIVREQGAGLSAEAGDTAALVECLRTLSADPALCRKLGSNGRVAAETRFSRRMLVDRFVDRLEAGENMSALRSLKTSTQPEAAAPEVLSRRY